MDSEAFQKEVVAYQAALVKAESIRKPVAVLYILQEYEDANGSQGTRFVADHVEDTVKQLVEYVDARFCLLHRFALLIVELQMAANGTFWMADGKRAPQQPTRGLLRDRLYNQGWSAPEENDVWIPVHSVRGGNEDFCATAIAECAKPEGWEDSVFNKYGIKITFSV